MPASMPDGLRDLLRRVDEVRGLAQRPGSSPLPAAGEGPALIETLTELVDELEHSQRRLIETNVQLVSLREVASHLTAPVDARETTRTVTRYLCRAFGFPHVVLLLVNRERGRLEGTWTHQAGEREHSVALELPLTGEAGPLARAVWLNRTVVLRHALRHPPAVLPDGHPLADVLATVSSAACVPLECSQAVLPAGHSAELCGERCMMGDTFLIAPPPGRAAERWAAEREERQRHCLACELMPMLGVIAVGRNAGAPPFSGADVTLLESIGLSIAPMIENARLTLDLRQSQRFLGHLLDSMASGLAAVNMRGEILAFNRAAETLLGCAAADVLGHPFGERFGPDGEALLQAALEHGREALREETVLRAPGGAAVPVSLTTSLLRDERRNVYGAIATFVDLGPLRRAQEQASQTDRLAALGRFTSSVAHEIRNPLTGIAAGVQYLSRGLADDGPAREHLTFILGEIKRLDRILQDLFEITHPRGLQLRATPLEDDARRAIQILQALTRERGVEVELVVASRVPPVPHDQDQIEQLLINLIKNAIEASARGAVVKVSIAPAPAAPPGPAPQASRRPARAAARATVPVGLGGAASPAGGAVIRVEDHGAGIEPEHLDKLFEPFFTTRPGGTGLGLYISHDIVKRHGGALTITSEPGRGSVFTLELPLDPQGGNP
jgi:PAS domain S-box-containing protein